MTQYRYASVTLLGQSVKKFCPKIEIWDRPLVRVCSCIQIRLFEQWFDQHLNRKHLKKYNIIHNE